MSLATPAADLDQIGSEHSEEALITYAMPTVPVRVNDMLPQP